MIRDIIDGFSSFFKVIPYASKYKLWKYLFFSGIISLFLAIIIVGGAYFFGDNLGSWIFSWYKWERGSTIIANLEGWVGGIFIVALSLILFKYLVLILSSPLMSFLSEQLERQLSNYPPHSTFSFSQAISDFNRGIIINLRNIIRELLITLVLLILSLIPVFTFITAPLIFITQAYYAGFGNLDFLLERHFRVKGSVQFVRKHRFLAISNGTVFLLLLMIPVLGWFIAPFFSTIASTDAGIPRIEKIEKY